MSRFAWLPAYGCLTWIFAASCALPAPALAAEQPVGTRFAIPAQPLSTALIAFGKQANVQVLTAGQTVDALRSHEVTGTFGADAALGKLLEGTGMTFTFVDARTVVIKPVAMLTGMKPKSASNSAITAATLLPPIQAIGLVGRDEGFMADVSSGPTRTVSDPLDVPQSVGIVTQGLLQSEQVQTVAEAIQNIAGAQYVDGSDGLPAFTVRGFVTGNGMTDGMPNNVGGIGDFPPMIGVERVEVLKGPESVLGDTSDNNNFGGLIDVVLKKPQPEPIHQLTFSIGEYGEKQLGLDLAGALNDSRSLSYRLVMNGDYSDGTQQGLRGKRNRYVAPSIGWSTPQTTFIAGMSWMMNHVPIPDHTILLDDSLSSAAPFNVRLDNQDDHTAIETRRLYYMLEHRFNHMWSFHSRAQYVRESLDAQYWSLDPTDSTGDVTATAQHYHTSDAYYVLQNDVTASFGSGWLQHSVMLGFDYSRIQSGNGYNASSNGGSGMSYNIFTDGPLPTVGSVLSPLDVASTYVSGSPWTTETGLFLQDQVALGTHWQALVALRRTGYELQTYDLNSGASLNQHRVQWVPNYGVVYRPTPDIAIYGSVSNGFQPDPGVDKYNHPLPPSLSRQIELGTKFDLFQNKARLTVAAYRIMLDNSSDLISFQPPLYFSHGPGQSNKGVEVEFNGQILPGWDVSAAATNAVIHNDDGSLPTGASRQRLNLWTSYTFQNDWLRGFGVAGGVLARSSTFTQLSDGTYIRIPGQADAAANVFYRTPRWSVTLGVKNLLDHTLYGQQFDETFVPFRNRRTYMLSGTVDF